MALINKFMEETTFNNSRDLAVIMLYVSTLLGFYFVISAYFDYQVKKYSDKSVFRFAYALCIILGIFMIGVSMFSLYVCLKSKKNFIVPSWISWVFIVLVLVTFVISAMNLYLYDQARKSTTGDTNDNMKAMIGFTVAVMLLSLFFLAAFLYKMFYSFRKIELSGKKLESKDLLVK